jgi:hypothetical protein
MLRLGGQPSTPSNVLLHAPAAPARGVKTGTLPGIFRRARRSSQQVVKLIGESAAEGGRFELYRRPTTKSPTKARKCLAHKDSQHALGRAWMARKDPKEPAKTRPEVKRFTSRARPPAMFCTQASSVPTSARKGT